jgi:hypothetical protein
VVEGAVTSQSGSFRLGAGRRKTLTNDNRSMTSAGVGLNGRAPFRDRSGRAALIGQNGFRGNVFAGIGKRAYSAVQSAVQAVWSVQSKVIKFLILFYNYWLGDLDSNQDSSSQSRMFYR